MEENKIKPTITIPPEACLVLSNLKSIVSSSEISAANLNGYKIFVIQLVHMQDLCGNRRHFVTFCGMSLVPLNRLLLYSFRRIDLASRYGGTEYPFRFAIDRSG